MKDKNEITLKDENKLERVDFNNPQAIINYGGNIMQSINNILEATAVLTKVEPVAALDENAKEALESLDKFLGQDHQNKNNIIANMFNNLLITIGIRDKSDNINFEINYEKYQEELKKICQAVEKQKQSALVDIDLKKSIISEMTPLIVKLDDKVKQGEADKKEFLEETEEIKANISKDTFCELRNRTRVAELFNDHLFQMKQASLLYKNQVEGYALQIGIDEQIVADCDSFLNITSYILKAQGVVRYNLNEQSKRVEFIRNVSSKATDVIEINSEEIESMKVSLGKTFSSIQNSAYQRKTEIEKNNEDLLKLSELLNNDEPGESSMAGGYQKRLGSKKWN